MSLQSEIAPGATIPQEKLAYFRERFRRRLYNFVSARFVEKERAGEITRADLARRIQRDPAQITKWLATPGNWTLDTVSDLLLGIGAEELVPQSTSVLGRPKRNYLHPEWLAPDDATNVIEALQQESLKQDSIKTLKIAASNAASTTDVLIATLGGRK